MNNFLNLPFINAYIEYWRRSFEFIGKTSRSNYWWSTLTGLFINLLLYMPYFLTIYDPTTDPNTVEVGIEIRLFGLLNYLPSLTMYIRRLNDVGKSWKWIFINFIPFIGPIWTLVLLTRPSYNQVK
tara:strand:- start:248 stop:625 length:378 start_codon:yes stop_codon:yes gene_type:complete